MAKRCNMPLEEWLEVALRCAVDTDRAHWEEMDRRQAVIEELSKDRDQFARLSLSHLANLPDSVFRLLVEKLALEREKGRIEGAQSMAARRG